MQVAAGRRRWLVLSAALSLALLGGIVTSVQASDPVIRFFGFRGDVTIDGAPLEPGTVIAAMNGDQEVGRTTVNQAGAWILDVTLAALGDDRCTVTFVVDGLRPSQKWSCGEARLRLALFSNGQERDSGSSPDTQDSGAMSDQESSAASDENGSQAAAEPDDSDEMTSDDGAEEPAEQARTIVRPTSPRTGTGGVLDAGESTNWPRAAAITALLTFGVAVMALLMSRRTNTTN